jgi:hypothetical protein
MSDSPKPVQLALFAPMVQVAQGDGSYLVKPGKPVEWLSPRQFAAAVGLHRNTIYDYLGTEFIPERFVQPAGVRKLKISAEAVAHFNAVSARKRAGL